MRERQRKRIGRQVRRAFIAAPVWTTAELAAWCWPHGVRRNWWRVRRGARKWAVPIGRRWPGGIIWQRHGRDMSAT
jgi:hypothetical protein